MPKNDISDISLEDLLGDLRAEGIDLGFGSHVTGTPRLPPLTPDAALRRRLDVLASREVRTLHGRHRRWSFHTLRHLVVCPAGVVVVDALETPAPAPFRPEGARGEQGGRAERGERDGRAGRAGRQKERLMAGGRDCTRQVEALLDGVRAVTQRLGRARPDVRTVDVHGVLASMSDDWPAQSGALTVHGIHVLSPARLGARIAGPGPLRSPEIELVTAALAKAFPPA